MGWSKSPPNVSACTDTVADLANAELSEPQAIANVRRAPQKLDVVSELTPANTDVPARKTEPPLRPSTAPSLKPERYWGIHVDDFCGLAQGKKWTRRAVKWILLHSLNQVFRPLDVTDTPYRQEPASIKNQERRRHLGHKKNHLRLGYRHHNQNNTAAASPGTASARDPYLDRSETTFRRYQRLA